MDHFIALLDVLANACGVLSFLGMLAKKVVRSVWKKRATYHGAHFPDVLNGTVRAMHGKKKGR